ncbi:hypothetical protein VYU27_002892 [Nannochloropsis oceanica]
MFGNLFGKQSIDNLDLEGWRRKRQREDIEEVLDSSDDEECEQLEEREQSRTEESGGGRRGKAGRMRLNEETTMSSWRTTTTTTLTEERDVAMQYMQQGGGGEGGGKEENGEERGEEDGIGGMLRMMTAMQEEPRRGVDEGQGQDEDEEAGEEGGEEEEEITEETLLKTLLEAVASAKRARGEAVSMEEEEGKEEDLIDLLDRPSQCTRGTTTTTATNPSIEQLLHGFRGILPPTFSSSPPPPLQDLLDALRTTHKDRLQDSAKQIAHELKKAQTSLHVRLPYRHGALLRASRQRQREQQREKEEQQQQQQEGGGGEGGGGAKKADEVFEQQMWTCNSLIDQLLALEEAGGRLIEYGREYSERNTGALEEKDAWIKTWQFKLLEQSAEVERTKGELRGMDEEFDTIVQRSFAASSEEGGSGLSSIPSLPTSPSFPSSLALVSTLLDVCRAPQYADLVATRQHKAEQLENKERKRQRIGTNLRLVEAFIALLRVLVEQGRQKVTSQTKKVEREIEQIRSRLHGDLKEEVVAAALRLQHVLEFHEARKERAGKSAKLREHELRQHTSLFGQDTPTETLRLEACVKELRRVVSHSTLSIERAMQRNQVFWARVEDALPETVARSLGSLFQHHMTSPNQGINSSSSNSTSTGSGKGRPLYSAYPAPSSAAAAAAAGGGGGGGFAAANGCGSNPSEAQFPVLFLQGEGGGREGGREGEGSPLVQIVAEGAAASQQQEEEERAKAVRGGGGMGMEEEKGVRGTEDAVMGVRVGGGGRRSPEGDGCVIM